MKKKISPICTVKNIFLMVRNISISIIVPCSSWSLDASCPDKLPVRLPSTFSFNHWHRLCDFVTSESQVFSKYDLHLKMYHG